MLMVGLVGSTALPITTLGAQPKVHLSPTSASAGTSVVATGSGFPARTTIVLTWDGSAQGLPATTVDRGGNLRVAFAVPDTPPGDHTLNFTRSRGGRPVASVTFTVTSSTSLGASPTPAPGATLAPGASAAPAPPTTVPAGTASPTLAPSAAPTSAPTAGPGPTSAPTPAPTATPRPTPAPTATPAPTTPTTPSTARLLFGLGSQAESARAAAITAASPIHMLSSWYNGPNDLGWMTDAWHQSIYDSAYAAGYSLHLITWSELPETTFTASTGTVCGRQYPLSDRWLGDMQQLAQAFGGPANGPALYVTLFSEFQTYACIDNAWSPNTETTAYYTALIDQYTRAVAIFHQYAPNARVSLGWGGWQTRWDEPAIGGGRSMIPFFAAAMGAGDFVSFQAMAGDGNVADIRAMTATLGAYRPVMLAHHMPDADTNPISTVNAVFAADIGTLLTASSVAGLVDDGLFAWSFLNDVPMQSSSTTFALVDAAVTAFGR
jgi:hypothetical protein